MKRLYTPWRMKYISKETREAGCVFCNALAKTDGPGNLIVARGEHALIILNKFPYTSGHMMVVPFDHKAELEELDAATRAELMELSTKCIGVLKRTYRPHAFNLGANIGEAAGAGMPGHFHIHIVPRWTGDSSFMVSVGETRVLPEEIAESYARIHAAWNQ